MSTRIGDYLFQRIGELGVKTIWGVPGDYELALLDLIPHNGLQFNGNPNELIASYAADGYARVNGVGAFVTTCGPGELSAYCGHAGCYCEFVPVVHVVGYPSVTAMKNKAIMHHTLGDGRFDMYHEMVKHISVDTTILLDSKTAAAEIDRVLTAMMHESRPVYIGVPVDIAYQTLPKGAALSPLATKLPQNDAELQHQVVAEIVKRIKSAKSPIIIVDGGAIRQQVMPETNELIKITKLPTFETCMSKGSIDETAETFGGVYQGGGSHEDVRTAVEASDAVLWIGQFPSDFNTGEFTVKVRPEAIIDFQRFHVKIAGQQYDVKMKYVLQALCHTLLSSPLSSSTVRSVTWDPFPADHPKGSTKLTQDFLWPALGRFLRKGDLVIAETGTSAFGITDSRFPAGANLIAQTVFGSIGFAAGAAVGSFLAAVETGKYTRGVLVTGEGSLQLTVQAITDLLRYNIKPVVFVLNNDGYTIERLIHGKDAPYNTVPVWDYKGLAKVFGPDAKSLYFGPVETSDQLTEVLQSEELNATDCFRLVELKLGRLDAPIAVRLAAAAVEEFNAAKTTAHAG